MSLLTQYAPAQDQTSRVSCRRQHHVRVPCTFSSVPTLDLLLIDMASGELQVDRWAKSASQNVFGAHAVHITTRWFLRAYVAAPITAPHAHRKGTRSHLIV